MGRGRFDRIRMASAWRGWATKAVFFNLEVVEFETPIDFAYLEQVQGQVTKLARAHVTR